MPVDLGYPIRVRAKQDFVQLGDAKALPFLQTLQTFRLESFGFHEQARRHGNLLLEGHD